MSNKHAVWITEKISDYMQSPRTALDAQSYATPARWTELGTDGAYIWGEFNQMQETYYTRNPTQVVIDLALAQIDSGGLTCNCSQASPCSHSLGLLLLYQQQPEAFSFSEQPAFLRERFSQHRKYRAPQGDVLTEIRQGLASLEMWLTHLIKHGLVEPHVQQFDYWDAMADRMLAAWMPGIAQWLREIANIPVRGGDWVELLLNELGRLYLLAKSFERFKTLPTETQADLREAVGWHLTRADFDAPTIRDEWLVIGQRSRLLRDQTPERFTWLYGKQTKQVVLLHDLESNAVLQGIYTHTGQSLDLTVAFIPSRAPLRAICIEHHGAGTSSNIVGASINEAIAQYGDAIAANPWIHQYPMLLQDVYVTRFDKYWTLRHADGTYIPIAPYFKHKWVMYAASGGQPINVGGTWNGSVFFPMSSISNGTVINLTNIPNYK